MAKIKQVTPEQVYRGCREFMGLISATSVNGKVALSDDGASQLFKLLLDMCMVMHDNKLISEDLNEQENLNCKYLY